MKRSPSARVRPRIAAPLEGRCVLAQPRVYFVDSPPFSFNGDNEFYDRGGSRRQLATVALEELVYDRGRGPLLPPTQGWFLIKP